MVSLPRHIAAEAENVELVLKNLEEAMERQVRTVVELAAIGAFLHNVYNGIENIMKQTLKLNNIKIIKGENWHKELLNLCVVNEIISAGLSDELYEYLAFRHFFVHGYGFMLDEAPLEPLAQNISRVWLKFISEVSQKAGGAVVR